MSFFDRFRSTKGKETASKPKAGKLSADEAKQKTFANVPASEDRPKKSEKASAPAKAPAVKESTHGAFRTLLGPVVTEKSTMVKQSGQYIFSVNQAATKTDVRHAIKHVYGVTPVSINMVNLPGKVVRYGRTTGRTMARRKAMVTLPTGKTIDPTK